jgi:DNA mismatch repair protein MutS
VREWKDEIVFLHRIERGRADRSYGIQVARLAGLPAGTIRRAHAVLESLAVHGTPAGTSAHEPGLFDAPGPDAPEPRGEREAETALPQAPLLTPAEQEALEAIRSAHLEAMTPLEAFDLLRRARASLG